MPKCRIFSAVPRNNLRMLKYFFKNFTNNGGNEGLKKKAGHSDRKNNRKIRAKRQPPQRAVAARHRQNRMFWQKSPREKATLFSAGFFARCSGCRFARDLRLFSEICRSAVEKQQPAEFHFSKKTTDRFHSAAIRKIPFAVLENTGALWYHEYNPLSKNDEPGKTL